MQWEYCLLEWMRFNPDEAQRIDSQGAKENVLAVCGVRFCQGQDSKQKVLATLTAAQAQEERHLFVEGLGLLGRYGWELVQVKEVDDGWDIARITTAYFKRAVQEGRPIDDAFEAQE